jgi:acyl-CoA reductase-like NAD-dependent aldehyde dehydrogenase
MLRKKNVSLTKTCGGIFRKKGNNMMLQVINPYNQKIFTELPFTEEVQIEEKIFAAREAFEKWRLVPLQDRIRYIKEGLGYVKNSRDEIAREITGQMGKPLNESMNEIGGVFERAEYMLSIAEESLSPDILPEKPGFYRRIEHEPLGVVLDIAAWNYPLLIAVNVVVPALLAGNTILLKHSTKTPLCGIHFEKAFNHSLPGLVNNLIISHEQTLALVRDPRVDHVVFTGSVNGGRQVYQAVSSRFIDVGLELGGKDPSYIAEDADLDFTVPNVVEGACYNAGQSCCAIERVYVHRKHYELFLEQAKVFMESYRLGDPLDNRTTLGPLVSRVALDHLDHQVADAMQRGAQLVLGGKRQDNTKGNFFLPTLIANVPNDADVMQEESFGPILPTSVVNSDQEALRLMNESRYGLTASVWTEDQKRAEWFARELKAGTIFQNRADYLDPGLPWTGVRESGKGSSLSKYGYLHLTRPKSIHFRIQT